MSTIFYYSSQLDPDVPGIDFLPFRKTLHISEYVLLFVLWGRALYQTWPGNVMPVVRWALLATIGYAASDELHQHYVGRDGNLIDVFIDSGMPFLSWLWLEVRQRRVRRQHRPAV